MVDRVILGRGRNTGGSSYGLWISNPGFDVKTCRPEDLAFDSDAAGFGGILASGTVTVAASSSQFVTVTGPDNKNLGVLWYGGAAGVAGSRYGWAPNESLVIQMYQTFPSSTQCRVEFRNLGVVSATIRFIITNFAFP